MPAGQGARNLSDYRPDIDGLRALAIVPILLLHCGVATVRGGFVGVDIFFVISGYLITGIILRECDAGAFSIVRFLCRRCVRILPALLVMVALVLVAGCLILLPNQIRDLARSVVASALFVSNVYFYQTADYFAAASDTKPLIHLWSLAVEEQFYLVFPLVMIGLHRLGRAWMARTLLAIALASFALGAWLARTDPSAGFFLLPGRIWELALGALVALGTFPALHHRTLRTLACTAAIAIIVASCLVIGIRWSFPVPFALAPAGATAILLAYGESGPTARLLALAPLRMIGRLSYSLYLWHRPIISFYQVEHGSTLSGTDSIILLAACLLAALASYRLVERPMMRHWQPQSRTASHHIIVVALITLSGGISGGLLTLALADSIRPLPPALSRVASYLGHDTTPAGRRQFSLGRCFSIPTGAPFDPSCLRLSSGSRNVVLMGDSHAAHLSEPLRTALGGTHLVQATAAGCLPLREAGGLEACRAVVTRAFSEIDFAKVDLVILSARWLRGDEVALQDTIRFLRAHGTRVLVVGPSVEYDIDLPTLIVRGVLRGDPTLPARFRRKEREALDRDMAPIVRASGAIYFSAVSSECPAARCRLMVNGAPFHFDHSHLTPQAARALVAALLATRALEPRDAH